MKKITNLLFVMLLLLCVSCSKDDKTDDNTDVTVPSLTGAITKNEVNFDNPNLKCTDCIIELLPATRVTSIGYANMTLKFNDNVEIIFKGITDSNDKTEPDKVYRLLKNCETITVNLKDGNKIVSSEVFNKTGDGGWWYMASDNSYFTIDLNIKGKQYTYKGLFKYVFPEEPVISTGAITDKGVDFNNPNLKCIEYSITAVSSSKANMTLKFNDAVEVIFKGAYDSRDKIDEDRIYRLLKNCETITVNLKDDNKIVSSETFDMVIGYGGWWKVIHDDSYFTIDLNLKGKQYIYTGQIKCIIPLEPIIPTGAITDKGVDFNNANLKCIEYSIVYTSPTIANMTLKFNDAVEIKIRGYGNTDDKTDEDIIYRLLKYCETITINLKDGNKIVSSEVFDKPNDGGWWYMEPKDTYFTIDLDLKGKQYEYKGQVKYVF